MRLSWQFFTVICFCGINGLYSESKDLVHHKKFYVDKKRIEFCNTEMRLKTKKGYVVVKSIHTDKKGVYLLASDVIKVEKREYRCLGCGRSFSSREEQRMHEWLCPGMRRRN